MKIEGTHFLGATRDRVYQSLIDPEVLQRCIPGCERLEKTAENTYAATIRAGVGAIKGVFTGTVRLDKTTLIKCPVWRTSSRACGGESSSRLSQFGVMRRNAEYQTIIRDEFVVSPSPFET